MNAQIDFLKRCKELGLQGGKLSNWLDEIESLRAENERLERNLSTTEQTMREYQELAAKRLEEIERLKEIKMAGEIMRDLLKQCDELLKETERHLLTFKRCELIDAANTEMINIELERLGMKEAA